MQNKSLYIMRDVGGRHHKFPSDTNPAKIRTYTYTAQRMGGTPTLTASIMYPRCLDDEWTGEEYVEFNGERYTILNIPSSSKTNTDERYKHDLSFVSERIKLEHEFFYDVITSDTEEQYRDRFRSNMSDFNFMGDIKEFVSRLNDSLAYTHLDSYHVVIDDGIKSEVKELSFSDKYFAEALQEINTTFKLAYYFVGKEIHVGYTENVITTSIEYGRDKGLVSIQKVNANNKTVDRITGIGSSDNIPYYYPNETPEGKIPFASALMPSIYRDSFGAERYYHATNGDYVRTFEDEKGEKVTKDYSDIYIIPDSEKDYYSFKQPYKEDNPHAAKQSIDTIRPSIVGMRNSEGKLFGEIKEIAFDEHDSDELVEGSGSDSKNYKHSFFYIKLHIYDGDYGFNLFNQALESETAKISMTSGACAACNFEIGVLKQLASDGKSYIFKNPVQIVLKDIFDTNNQIVDGDFEEKVNVNNIMRGQQNTQSRSVWIALKKDNETFGVVMPNATYNYKPKVGDTFVITGIKMPQTYILRAEKELDKALIKYMKENNEDKFNFSVKFSRIWIQKHPNISSLINENARLTIRYDNKDILLYVTNYSRKSDDNILEEITVELSDEVSVTQSSLALSLNAVKEDILGQVASVDAVAVTKRHYISKTHDDRSVGKVASDQGFEVGVFKEGVQGGAFYKNEALIKAEADVITARQQIKTPDYLTSMTNGRGAAIGKDERGKTFIEIDKAYIRDKAVFSELEIDKVSYAGGDKIYSRAGNKIVEVRPLFADGSSEAASLLAADGRLISYQGGLMTGSNVLKKVVGWRCFFKADDGEKTVENLWRVGDMAYCREVNLEGAEEREVSIVTKADGSREPMTANRYWWRLVARTGTAKAGDRELGFVDFLMAAKTTIEGEEYDSCDPWNTCEEPREGDDMAQVGSKTDADRRNVKLLEVTTARESWYVGIDDYTLPDAKRTLLVSPTEFDVRTAQTNVADKGSVEEVKGSMSEMRTEQAEIRQTTEQITLRVGEVEAKAEGVSQRMTTAESEIKQTTEAIKSKVEKTDYDTDKAQAESRISTIEQTAESISLKVDHVVATPRRNLVADSYTRQQFHLYQGLRRTVTLVQGKKYVITINGHIDQQLRNDGRHLGVMIFNDDWTWQQEVAIDSLEDVTVSAAVAEKDRWSDRQRLTGEYTVAPYLYLEGNGTEYKGSGKGTLNWMQIEEGDTATPWSMNESDSERGENLLPTIDLLANGMTEDEEVTLPNGERVTSYMITSSAADDDVARAVGEKAVFMGQSRTFTLSFYAKGSGTVQSLLYNADDNDLVQGVVGDGRVVFPNGYLGWVENTLTPDWKKYVITWTAGRNAVVDVIIARLNSSAQRDGSMTTLYLAAPKLETGGRATAYYGDGEAGQLTMQKRLLATGIDIEQMAIKLVADMVGFYSNDASKTQPYIKVGVDALGIPYLIFMRPDGTEAYNLGYGGLHEIINNAIPAAFTEESVGRFVTANRTLSIDVPDLVRHNFNQGNRAYQYTAGKTVSGDHYIYSPPEGEAVDGRFYPKKDMTDNGLPTEIDGFAPDGLYFKGDYADGTEYYPDTLSPDRDVFEVRKRTYAFVDIKGRTSRQVLVTLFTRDNTNYYANRDVRTGALSGESVTVWREIELGWRPIE